MHVSHPPLHDVIVAGAGPVGLFLACELRLAGVSVLVLEQSSEPRSPLKALPFGLRGLSAPTLEALYRRGLLEEINAARGAEDTASAMKASAHWMSQQRRPAGHFAGIQFFRDDVNTAKWPYYLPSPTGLNQAIDMQSLESVLARRAEALGAEIRRGVSLEDLQPAAEGVTVRAGGEVFYTRWLIGCDGGRSTVRKASGFDFVGTEPEFTGYSLEVVLADPECLVPGRTYTADGMYTYAKPGAIAMVDFDGGAFHRTHPITLDHVQAVLRRVSGAEVNVTELRLAATWTDRAFQATAYRQGRVLLAGDAAHIHSPLGGQGLNLGLGDAMNLGWKLAATIQGRAPADLLDSYFVERSPEAARILDWSRAQVALMRPTSGTPALAAIVRDLINTSDGTTYFAERVWGISLHYDLGDSHPLVGRTVPDFELLDGTRVGSYLRDGKGLLMDFDSRLDLRAVANRWPAQIKYLSQDAKDRLGVSALLVRPDGVVAWVSENVAKTEGTIQATQRWFGEPSN